MSAEKYNPAVQDFVSKLPGVNTKNIRRILNNVDDLEHLISMSKVRLLTTTEKNANRNLLTICLNKSRDNETTNRCAHVTDV